MLKWELLEELIRMEKGDFVNELSALSIFRADITGSVLIGMVLQLFESPIENMAKIIIVATATSFVVFVVEALTLRRRLNEKNNIKINTWIVSL